MSQFTDTVIESAQAAPTQTTGGGAPAVEVVNAEGRPVRGRAAKATTETTGGGQFAVATDKVDTSAGTGRVLPDSVRAKIQEIAKAQRAGVDAFDPDEPLDEDEPTAAAADTGAAADDDDPDDPEVVAKPAAAPDRPVEKVEATPDERDAMIERQKSVIERLRAEVEESRKGLEDAIAARAKRLDEAEESYLDSPTAAFRSWVAGINGVEPDSEEAKKEIQAFLIELTSELSSVPLDAAHRAERESARTRKAWEREKRRREAGEKKQTEEQARKAREQQVQYATGLIRKGLDAAADKYPSLDALAPILGRAPEMLVFEVLQRGLEAGDFDPNSPDEALIEAAASAAEKHYRPQFEKLRAKFNPKQDTSTATPDAGGAPAVAAKDQSSTRQSKGARVTSADASVAPATPPASKPSTQRKPPPISDDEARRRYALRHLRQHRPAK